MFVVSIHPQLSLRALNHRWKQNHWVAKFSFSECKMDLLINPNIAYLSIVGAVIFVMLTFVVPRSKIPIVGFVICLAIAWFEISQLRANPWDLIIVVLSPIPFFVAVRTSRLHYPLLFLSLMALTIGSYFIFTDQNGTPTVNLNLVMGVSFLSALFAWGAYNRQIQKQNEEGIYDPDSVVGLIGEARTEIDSSGLVLLEGELWRARSKTPIPAGSAVRVIRSGGGLLTVQKVERLSKK
jgi:membrane-bound serine protease (ClpP class)